MTTLYLVLAAIGGGLVGLVVMALLAVGHDECSYQAGYHDGFSDGMKSIDGVG